MPNSQWRQPAKTYRPKSIFLGNTSITNFIFILSMLMLALPAHAEDKKDARLYHTPKERRSISNIQLMDGVSAGVLLEVEANYSKQGRNKSSDITLATFEFNMNAELSDLVKGDILMLWEEDDTEPIDLDEATITIGDTDSCPFHLTAGKMYIPFGVFNSHFVSDPFVLELAETRESAATLGYSHKLFNISVASFNGSMDEDEDDQANNTAAAITLTPGKHLELGAYWISDIGESDVMEEIITDSISTNVNYSEVPAAGAYISAEAGNLIIDIEYLTATDDFNPGILNATAQKPSALNIEAALHCFEKYDIAVKYEQTKDFPGFPENQHGICYAYALTDTSTISLEYLVGKFENNNDKRHLVTTQLAMEF